MAPTASQCWRKHSPRVSSVSTCLTPGLAQYVITREREIGDIEHVRPIPEADQIANRFFSARENVSCTASEPQARGNCWTRKEAYVKAIGDGLALGLMGLRVLSRATG